jgi:hypothetical protein
VYYKNINQLVRSLLGKHHPWPAGAQVNHQEISVNRFAISKAVAAFVLGVSAMSAHGTPIQGSASLAFGQVALSLGEVDWNAALNPGFDPVPTYGSFSSLGAANTGAFAAGVMSGITMGSLQDMSRNPVDANFVPDGAGITSNFIKFNAQPGWLFVTDYVAPGSFLAMPFLFTQDGSNVKAQLSMSGWACDMGGDGLCDLSDDRSTWTGNFSVNYTNNSVAQLETILLGGGTLANNSWSGMIVATADVSPTGVPEPSTVALSGLALAGLALARRRRA